MNQLQKVFSYQETPVRTIIKGGEPWLVLADVCNVLELSNPSMVASRLENDDLSTAEVTDSIGRQQQAKIINEFGLYETILLSRKPEAKQFKRWVTREVLPEIRKTGQYGLPQNYKEALLQLVASLEERERLEAQNKLMAPKAEMYDILLSADNAQTMTEVAKVFGMGRNKLFSLLREKKILMTGGPKHNLPYQRYIDNDYFEVREVTTIRGEQNINVSQTLVAAKGLDLIAKTLNKKAS